MELFTPVRAREQRIGQAPQLGHAKSRRKLSMMIKRTTPTAQPAQLVLTHPGPGSYPTCLPTDHPRTYIVLELSRRAGAFSDREGAASS